MQVLISLTVPGKLFGVHIANRNIRAIGQECFGNGAPNASSSGSHKDTLCHDLLPQCSWFLVRTHGPQPFGCAVMERPKPAIPRHFRRTVVALKVPMMQLVEECPHLHPRVLAKDQSVIARVRCRRRQRQPVAMKQHVNGVRWDNQMDQQR